MLAVRRSSPGLPATERASAPMCGSAKVLRATKPVDPELPVMVVVDPRGNNGAKRIQ